MMQWNFRLTIGSASNGFWDSNPVTGYRTAKPSGSSVNSDMSEQIVDASFVEVPRQRNSRDENDQIKKGQTPKSWKAKPNKLRQKDRDARWTKKNKMNFYGYKNQLKVDQGNKLISSYMVTDAAVHDSQELETLIDKDDAGQKLYGVAAYIGQEECIEACGMQSEIHEKELPETTSSLQTRKQRIARSRRFVPDSKMSSAL
jgi:IS5 family transposase